MSSPGSQRAARTCLTHLCRGRKWRWRCSSVGQKGSRRCPGYRCWSPALACHTLFDLHCWHMRRDLEVSDPHPCCLRDGGRGGGCGRLHQLLSPFLPRFSPPVLSFWVIPLCHSILSHLPLIVFCGSQSIKTVSLSESFSVPVPYTWP